MTRMVAGALHRSAYAVQASMFPADADDLPLICSRPDLRDDPALLVAIYDRHLLRCQVCRRAALEVDDQPRVLEEVGVPVAPTGNVPATTPSA
jgi:hypothetical protein